MSVPLVINGVTFNYPQQFDSNWGPTLTNWSTAVTSGMLQTSGVNAATFIKSATTNPSSSGMLRLARTDAIGWRNALNNGNLLLTVDGSNNLLFNGVAVGSPTTLTNTHIFVGNASNVPTDVAMSGDIAVTNTGVTTIQAAAVTGSKIASGTITESNVTAGTLTDTSISASAAIAFSKMAALNAFITPVTDSMGALTNSATTATELGYVHGVTSNIQTQINAITGAGTFSSGMLMAFAGSSAPSGWLICDGTAVSRATYSALFGVIGTTYGVGDGSTTFNLPQGVNNTMVGQGGTIVASLGSTAGASTHTISSAELPTHTHSVTDPGHSHGFHLYTTTAVNGLLPTGQTGSEQGASPVGPSSPPVVSNTTGITIANAGSSTAMSLVQPSLGINWIIKT